MKKENRSNNGAAEFIILGIFACMLLAAVILDISVLFALLAGYVLFVGFALFKKVKVKDILKASIKGIRTIKNILIAMVLIGILTGLWRACGTIAAVTYYSSMLIRPSLVILAAFLLNCLMSFLTGTSFGTAATMGTICMAISQTVGINPLFTGGAVLAGAYFGDRCSPVSTSALLIAELTGTGIYSNIKQMVKSAAIPFAITSAAYFVIGLITHGETAAVQSVTSGFKAEFLLGFIPFIPAILIIVLALFRIDVKISMGVSIIAAAVICFFYQKLGILEILQTALLGYKTHTEALASLFNGGGVRSMVSCVLIIFTASLYSGIFEVTGLLDPLQRIIDKPAQKLSPFAVTVPVSIVIGAIGCSQTLAIMLTHQLCRPFERDDQKLAVYLEDSAVVTSPLIPWSIAGAVPLATIGAPAASALFAFYLYLIPICGFIYHKKRANTVK